MKKYIKYLYITAGVIIIIIISIFVFSRQLFKNNSANHSLGVNLSENVAKNVKIICYFGNKKTIDGGDSGLTFTKDEFDSDGNFINYEKNGDLQKVCEMGETEMDKIINNGDEPRLFDVVLTTKDDLTKAITSEYESYLNKPYQFDNFSVAFKEYKATEVNLEDHAELLDMPDYWSNLRKTFDNINDSKLDFAGRFKLISMGNGTMRDLFIVDGLTGKIHSYENMSVPNASRYLFKNNSRLLVQVIDNELGFASNEKAKYVYAYYFLQDNDSFKLLDAYVYKDKSFIKINN